MGLADDLADKLAMEVLEASEILEDEDLAKDIAKVIGASSQTYEESFLTAMRVLKANKQARALLKERLKAYEAKLKAGA
ncbi:hypothetical protein ACS3SW_02020 [Roseobacteraceae bacterium S113]